ncbi:hypothetical protein [Vreelandella utahensis]|uniref:hypothetical protein n=1 Tax=Vreelandella halophila TaxID=86177 RepID=UPI00117BCD15|nr:hypothetical protein [Halomonas utahensis]
MPASSTSSSSGFSRIDVPLSPSPGLAAVAATPWLLPAALVLSLEGIPDAVTVGVAAACAAGAIAAVRQQLLRARHSPVRLTAGPDGLRAVHAGGGEHPVRVGPGSRIAHRFLWLRLSGSGPARPLLLSTLPGIRNTDARNLRRLTGWLRLGPARAGDE